MANSKGQRRALLLENTKWQIWKAGCRNQKQSKTTARIHVNSLAFSHHVFLFLLFAQPGIPFLPEFSHLLLVPQLPLCWRLRGKRTTLRSSLETHYVVQAQHESYNTKLNTTWAGKKTCQMCDRHPVSTMAILKFQTGFPDHHGYCQLIGVQESTYFSIKPNRT